MRDDAVLRQLRNSKKNVPNCRQHSNTTANAKLRNELVSSAPGLYSTLYDKVNNTRYYDK